MKRASSRAEVVKCAIVDAAATKRAKSPSASGENVTSSRISVAGYRLGGGGGGNVLQSSSFQ